MSGDTYLKAALSKKADLNMWIFLGALVVVGILASAISGSSKRNEEINEKAEKTKLIEMRAKSYADYLKRTSDRPDIAAMTENELSEHVFDAIRTFNKQTGDLVRGLMGLGFIVICIAVVVIAADGPKAGAVLVGVVGIGWLWDSYTKETKKLADTYITKGFEVERLKIED